MVSACLVQGEQVPAELLGELRETPTSVTDAAELQHRMETDGYVFTRGVVDRDTVLEARSEVFQRLVEVGEIQTPAADGIFTGASRREELPDLGEFWMEFRYPKEADFHLIR